MHALEFLTVEDRTLLLEQGEIASYAPEEVILEEGGKKNALYILLDGAARVERTHMGKRMAVATLKAGDIFGEISFLEEVGASASVVADANARVLAIGGRRLNSLLQSVPGLGSRFYQSLAVILARRLRETTAMLPPLMVEEVAQVRRLRSPRTGLPGADAMPPALLHSLEEFRSAILAAERLIAGGHASPDQVQPTVDKGCAAMNAGLRRHVDGEGRAAGIGAFVFRETFAALMTSRLLDRAFAKPRGFAGDHETMDLVYDNHPAGDTRLGPFVDRWALQLDVCRAWRAGRGLMTARLRSRAEDWTGAGPMPALSLGCGSAREAIDLFDSDDPVEAAIACVDIDADALRAVAERARPLGAEDRFTLYQDNVLRLAAGVGKIAPPPQWLIYAVGLADYMEDRQVVAMLDWMFEHLLPGGEAVVGNLDRGNPDRPLMEHITDWLLAHRTAEELQALFARSRFGTAAVTVEADPAGIQLLARVRKE